MMTAHTQAVLIRARMGVLLGAASLALLAGCASEPPAPGGAAATPAAPVLASQSAAYSALPARPAVAVASAAPVPTLAQVEAGLADAATASGVQLSNLPSGGLLLRASGEVAFGSTKATASPRFKTFLQALAHQLQAHPEVMTSITGHTDSVGGAKGNERLSLARARAVQHELVSQGVAVGRLVADGKGAREPIAGNDRAEGRTANRRVDIVLANDAN